MAADLVAIPARLIRLSLSAGALGEAAAAGLDLVFIPPQPKFLNHLRKTAGNCLFFELLLLQTVDNQGSSFFLASFVVPVNIIFFLTLLIFFVTHCAHVF